MIEEEENVRHKTDQMDNSSNFSIFDIKILSIVNPDASNGST